MADNDFNSDGFPKDFSPRDFSETPRHRAEDAAKNVEGTSIPEVNETKEFGDSGSSSRAESVSGAADSSAQSDFFSGLSQQRAQAENNSQEGELNIPQQQNYNVNRPNSLGISDQFGTSNGNIYGQGTQQGFGQYPQGPQGFGANSQVTRKEDGFFSGLFDFKFNKFITVEHAQVVYIIAMVIGALVWLANVLGGFIFSGVLGSMAYELDIPTGAGFSLFVIFFNFVASTVGFFFYIISIRLVLEMMVSNVRIAQNTRDLLNK